MSSLLSTSLGFTKGRGTEAEKGRDVGAGCVAGPPSPGGRAPELHFQGRSSGKGQQMRGVYAGWEAEQAAAVTHTLPHPHPSPGKWANHRRCDRAPGTSSACGLRQPRGRGTSGESHRLCPSAPRCRRRRGGAPGVRTGGQMSVLEIPQCGRRPLR